VASTPGGYRADDARFLIGSIYWHNDRREDAVRWWRQIRVEQTNCYRAAAAPIREAIDGVEWQQVSPRAIEGILDAEQRRWSEFWWGRLQRFGYSWSTY
jgi:hypothetical protein